MPYPLEDLNRGVRRAAHAPARLEIQLARSAHEIDEALRLRYRVFAEELGAVLEGAGRGIDHDRFDDHCDHLLVRDRIIDQVVGCYRILPGDRVAAAGGWYSEQEFEVSGLAGIRSQCAEMGRACIDPAYRNGGVILMLWTALARYLAEHRYAYAVGAASISLADGGANASAVCAEVLAHHLAPAEYRVKPHHPYPWRAMTPLPAASVPALIKGYLRLGAWVGGDPAWDPDFNTADLFILMPVARFSTHYARRFYGHSVQD
jgi:putative hemolysin